jgi:ribonuclease G
LEAVQEIVSQLRLRNIGGIIVIDFIDMEKEANRRKVYETLKEAIKKDKARTKILKISEFGLVEMTRQRTRESLENMLLSACPYCEGRGRIKSNVTIAYEILRAIKQEKARLEDGKRIIVRIHPDIANLLYDQESQSLDEMEREINHKIIIKASNSLPHEKYEISTL